MNIEEVTREFESKASKNEHLRSECLFILEPALKNAGVKLHSVTSRIKTLTSFLEKVQRKQYGKPFEEVQDIVGLRVVCLFLSDIAIIGEMIRSQFHVLDEDNKVEGTDASSFGYMSVHFIARMKKEHSGPRYDHIAGLPFEIQVRTIAMDAWANVSHHLEYKSDKDVPSELKRDFYALSGLFYVADKHFEMFYGSSKQSQQNMTELFEEATPQKKAEQEINLDSLTAFLHSKFPERGHSDSKSVSELVDELLMAGYQTVGEVDEIIESTKNVFPRYEKANPPSTGTGRFADVGVVRVCASIKDEKFVAVRTANYLSEKQITEYNKYRALLSQS